MSNRLTLIEPNLHHPKGKLLLLARLAARLIGAIDRAELVRNMFELIASELELDAFISYGNEDGGLKLLAHGGLPEAVCGRIERLLPGQRLCSEALRHRATSSRTAIQASSALADAILRGLGLNAFVCLPLAVGDRELGAIGFGRRRMDHFSLEDISFLESAAWYVALSMHRLHTEAALRDSEKRLAESEERLRLGIQVARFGTGYTDLTTGLSIYTPELRAIFGLGPDGPIPYDMLTEFVHEEDRERVLAETLAAQDPKGPGEFSIEHRIIGTDGQVRWVLSRGRTLYEGAGHGQATALVGAVQDITERKRAELALAESEERLRLAQELGGVGTFDWDITRDEGFVSDVLRRILGLPADFEVTRARLEEMTHPDNLPSYRSAIGAAIAGNTDFDVEWHIIRPLDQRLRWIHARGGVVCDARGYAVRFIGVVRDITERKEQEERERILTAEVDHRARNLLAVVQAVLNRTAATSGEGFMEAVKGRVSALARAHSLLAASRWAGVELPRIVIDELASLGMDEHRMKISGPPVTLQPTSAQTLALAFHELATNAERYGALSASGGRVSVDWSIDAAGQLSLRWVERGGPPAMRPTRQGFGIGLIKGSIEHQLRGVVDMSWTPEGLECLLKLPAAEIIATSGS